MKRINYRIALVAIGALVMGLFLGWYFFSASSQDSVTETDEMSTSKTWTCSMHPQIRQPEPGQCPICGMELIPVGETDDTESYSTEIKMSPTAMKLANVQTTIIQRQKPVKEIRLNGKIQADERKIYAQSSHIPGRVEELSVNFTGEAVRKGQVLAHIYSPELVLAQEELFEAEKIQATQPELFKAARDKLLNWKLTEKQIDEILTSGEIQEQFPVLADVSGVVLAKRVKRGDYVKKGQSLYEVADLSQVWVMLDIYEDDLKWINEGDEIMFSVKSLPGEQFQSKISFIDPIINPGTRVAKARAEVRNTGKLKPDMFVVSSVKSPLEEVESALIVPKSAVMWTGERSVVYIKKERSNQVSFEMREVLLGPSLGDSYMIEEGLEEGVEIATNGTFSIDAAAQLAGKPSMMNPDGGVQMSEHEHGSHGSDNQSHPNQSSSNKEVDSDVRNTISGLIKEYLKLKNALVSDNQKEANQLSHELKESIQEVPMRMFEGTLHTTWMSFQNSATGALSKMEDSEDLKQTRAAFIELSKEFIGLAEEFGPFEEKLFIQHCPMANDNKGADWLSEEEKISNPYFGAQMLRCGKVVDKIH